MIRNLRKRSSLALLGFAMLAIPIACGGGGGSTKSSSTNNTSTNSNTSATPATSSAGNEDQVVAKVVQVQNQLRDLSATVHSDSSQSGRSFTSDGTVMWTASPERFYAKTTSSLTNGQTELILDTPSQATYVKVGANWIKSPTGGASAQGAGFMPTLKGDAFKGFKVVGKETVQGKPTWHLTGASPYTPGSATTTTVPNTSGTLDAWVGQSDYLLVKQSEVLKSADGGFSLKADVVVNSVNSGLTIPLPNVG
jgi:hypothetical protein